MALIGRVMMGLLVFLVGTWSALASPAGFVLGAAAIVVAVRVLGSTARRAA
jgi:hypothetical protein